MSDAATSKEQVAAFQKDFHAIEAELGKVIVGHRDVIRGVLTALFAGGHCLLEGVPGLGKTLLVRTLGSVLQLKFNRIQFTPDLMPADILGTNLVAQTPQGDRVFKFQSGPIFTQIALADEINRATPKTQSAMLEAMQEHAVTVAGQRYVLEEPFLVLATQNPLEMEGTYPLPEAQLDRFLFKIMVSFSSLDELRRILERTTDKQNVQIDKVIDGPRVLAHQALVKDVVAAPHVKDYVSRLVWATHPESELAPEIVKKFVRYGSSPRGAQSLVLAAKVAALVDGRYNAGFQDVKAAAHPALRHRILLNFEGEAEGIKIEKLIDEILQFVTPDVKAAVANA
ncbi:MAG TPA: MoxR family ATPase [Planctomycetota bacterium]|jgi:MoxR-like ATPase|nr:MoxR family ATPase [Planctomycetota bacterium]